MRLRVVLSIRLRHPIVPAPLHKPVLHRPAYATPLCGRLPPSRLPPFSLRPSSHPPFHLRRLQLPSLIPRLQSCPHSLPLLLRCSPPLSQPPCPLPSNPFSPLPPPAPGCCPTTCRCHRRAVPRGGSHSASAPAPSPPELAPGTWPTPPGAPVLTRSWRPSGSRSGVFSSGIASSTTAPASLAVPPQPHPTRRRSPPLLRCCCHCHRRLLPSSSASAAPALRSPGRSCASRDAANSVCLLSVPPLSQPPHLGDTHTSCEPTTHTSGVCGGIMSAGLGRLPLVTGYPAAQPGI